MKKTKKINWYVVPAFVVPGKHKWERDFQGIPYMFCRTLPDVEELPRGIEGYGERDAKKNDSTLTPKKIAERQALEFGEEFLPAIYMSMVWWLGHEKATQLFDKAAKLPRGRPARVTDHERDRRWYQIYLSKLNDGSNHKNAINEAVAVILQTEKDAHRISVDSVRKHLSRMVNRKKKLEDGMKKLRELSKN